MRNSSLAIEWQPRGITLGTRNHRNKWMRNKDGDTPLVEMEIRMLSIDTPEIVRRQNEEKTLNSKFAELADKIQRGDVAVTKELAQHLIPRLSTGLAASLQNQQANEATAQLDLLFQTRLKTTNGKMRRLFLRTADEPFDKYGRLLAYVAPEYTKEERKSLPPRERPTFNLLMVANGWAAPFLIYPNLPKNQDLELFYEAARTAYVRKKGLWKESNGLTGYEFRMVQRLCKLGVEGSSDEKEERKKKPWISRHCADLETGILYAPQQYVLVPPYRRLFIRDEDCKDAKQRLGLREP